MEDHEAHAEACGSSDNSLFVLPVAHIPYQEE